MRIYSLILTIVLALGSSLSASAADQFISIGTGGVTGVYYPTGGAICRLVNKTRKEHGIRCAVESTGGSVYNINTIKNGELEFGVAQSDWQYHALKGTSKFKGNAFPDLRAMMSIHGEPFTVLARKDSGVKTFADIKGKRVNIGNPGSGQRGTMEVVMKAFGWKTSDFKLATEYKASEMAKQLCDGNIDVMVYTVGHPNGAIKEATTTCDAIVVPVTGKEIDKLIAENGFYRKALIPGGMYRGTDKDVITFGVGATLVTSAKVSEKAAYTIAKSVMTNIETFRKLHPAFQTLKPEEMVKDGLSAPLHKGALKAYKELKLIK